MSGMSGLFRAIFKILDEGRPVNLRKLGGSEFGKLKKNIKKGNKLKLPGGGLTVIKPSSNLGRRNPKQTVKSRRSEDILKHMREKDDRPAFREFASKPKEADLRDRRKTQRRKGQ